MKHHIDRICLIIAVALVVVAGFVAVSLAGSSADQTLLELATPAGEGLSPPEWPTQTVPAPDATPVTLPTPTAASYPGPEPTAEPYPAPYPVAEPGAFLPFVEWYP